MGSIYNWASASLPNSTLNDFLSPVAALTASLSSLLQNGQSSHGLLPSPNLPFYLGDGAVPWGNRTVTGTNSYTDVPSTGAF